jgi:putative FmdB family regulatory protein
MPIYEYFCPSCRLVFEHMLPVKRIKDLIYCPECNMPSEKIISNCASTSDGKLNVPDKEPFRGY